MEVQLGLGHRRKVEWEPVGLPDHSVTAAQ
jgi:hypothetical protein